MTWRLSPIIWIGAAIAAAVIFGTIAHDALGLTRYAIRTDALTAAIFIFSAVSAVALIERR